MAIIYCKKTRRQFLLGSGKSLLALPLLPSLMPRKAWGQATQAPRRMMIFHYDHNNHIGMWPSPERATTAVGPDGSREVMMNTLGRMASHSPALNNARYEALKNRNLITMVRGFDIRHGAAHGNGGLAAAQDRESQGGFPTIDSIVENSQTVYPNGTPVSVRKALRVGGNFYYRKVGNGTTVERLPYYNRELGTFYNEVFSSLTGGTVPQQDLTNQLKSNILNRVFESFTSFRNGTKISSDDRARLDQHMDYLSDLQRNFASVQTPVNTCSRPNDPGNLSTSDNPVLGNQTYMDLLAVAFKCGLTKFGVMSFEAHNPQWIPGLNTQGHGFHAVMHGEHGDPLQLSQKIHWWRYFSSMIADRFLAPLEEMEGNTGRSYLENMVTVLMCQGGWVTPNGGGGHNGLDSQQIMIGSMGGHLRSGRYMVVPRSQTGNTPYRGDNLPYNCFLLTLLNLMGVPPSDYAYATPDGRGVGYYGGFSSNRYDYVRNRFYQPVNELLT